MIGGKNLGGVSVESQDNAWKIPGLGEGNGLLDQGLVTEMDTVKRADANDGGGPFRVDVVGAEVNEHCVVDCTRMNLAGTEYGRDVLVELRGDPQLAR